MERAVIDTNVLVNFFLNTELTEKAYNLVKLVLTDYSPVIFTNIFEETFILIRELMSKGIARFYDQRDFIEKNGYDLFLYRKFFEFLKSLISQFLKINSALRIFKALWKSTSFYQTTH